MNIPTFLFSRTGRSERIVMQYPRMNYQKQLEQDVGLTASVRFHGVMPFLAAAVRSRAVMSQPGAGFMYILFFLLCAFLTDRSHWVVLFESLAAAVYAFCCKFLDYSPGRTG